jgi:hypothetical protein
MTTSIGGTDEAEVPVFAPRVAPSLGTALGPRHYEGMPVSGAGDGEAHR